MVADLPEIAPLDRLSFYGALGIVSFMEPDTEDVMQERALRHQAQQDVGPHARDWHLSFHASAFPGDPADACERFLVYRMMDIPAASPMPPWVTSTGVVGKAGELDIAEAWYEAGRLLAVPESVDDRDERMAKAVALIKAGRHSEAVEELERPPVHQLGFEDPEHWLTGSVDLPILKKGWRKPYICEIKGKADEVLQEMLTGRRKDGTMAPNLRGPDPAHVRQIKASLGLAHEFDWGEVTVCERCWRIVAWTHLPALLGQTPEENPDGIAPWSDAYGYCSWCRDYCPVTFDLEPPDCGEIYYWSRSWPRTTKSFFITHDDEYMSRGREVLSRAKYSFLTGALPKRPDHFQWSIGPCGQCAMRASCRLDSGLLPRKRKPDKSLVVNELMESNTIPYAQSLRPDYDPWDVRRRVIEEWS